MHVSQTQQAPGLNRRQIVQLYAESDHSFPTLREYLNANDQLERLYKEAATYPHGGPKSLWRTIGDLERRLGA